MNEQTEYRTDKVAVQDVVRIILADIAKRQEEYNWSALVMLNATASIFSGFVSVLMEQAAPESRAKLAAFVRHIAYMHEPTNGTVN